MPGQTVAHLQQHPAQATRCSDCGAQLVPRKGGHGLCGKCYQRWYKTGQRTPRTCAAPGCTTEITDRGRNGKRVTCSPECARAYKRHTRGRGPAERVRLAHVVLQTAGNVATEAELGDLWDTMTAAEGAVVEAIRRLRGQGVSWDVLAQSTGKTRTDILRWYRRRTEKGKTS